MIAKQAMLDAVNLLLVGLYPDRTVYRDALPKDFARPCFALLLGKRRIADGGCDETLEITQPITVQCIDQVDAHYEASTDRLHEVSDAVEMLFLCGYVRVEDRCLAVTDVHTVRELDAADVNITLRYLDDRPASTETFPPAAEMITKITARE